MSHDRQPDETVNQKRQSSPSQADATDTMSSASTPVPAQIKKAPAGKLEGNDLCLLGQIYRQQAAEIAYNLLATKKSQNGGCVDDVRITMPGWGRQPSSPTPPPGRKDALSSSQPRIEQNRQTHATAISRAEVPENAHNLTNSQGTESHQPEQGSHACETDASQSDYASTEYGYSSTSDESDEEFENRLINLEEQVNQLKRERLEIGEIISKSEQQGGASTIPVPQYANSPVSDEPFQKKLRHTSVQVLDSASSGPRPNVLKIE